MCRARPGTVESGQLSVISISVVDVRTSVRFSCHDLFVCFDQSAGRVNVQWLKNCSVSLTASIRSPTSFLWIPFLVPYRLPGGMSPSFDVLLLSMEIRDRFPVSTSVGD